MSKAPPVPPANRTTKGPGGPAHSDPDKDTSDKMQDHKHHNSGEQGQTANIKQNTTNAGFFKGRRGK